MMRNPEHRVSMAEFVRQAHQQQKEDKLAEAPVLRATTAVPTQILIVEDNREFLDYLISTLQQQPGLQIVGQTGDGRNAVRLAESLQPNLILLDIGLPGMNGIAAARQMLRVAPNSRIVFVTQESHREVVYEALSTGAHGYVLKTCASRDLLCALANVCGGDTFLSPSLRD